MCVKAIALTSAQAGSHVGDLYRLATAGLALEERKIVQRRMKEALLKGSILYGVPRCAQGLGPLFGAFPKSEIDTYAPRYVGNRQPLPDFLPSNMRLIPRYRTEKMKNEGDEKVRQERAKKYFETLWGGAKGAQPMIDRAVEYQPDHCESNIEARRGITWKLVD